MFINVIVHCYACVLSHVSPAQLFETLWSVACQAPLSMGFSRQEYWSGLPCPPPGDRPHPGMKPPSLRFPALAGRCFFLPLAPPVHCYSMLFLGEIRWWEWDMVHIEKGHAYMVVCVF